MNSKETSDKAKRRVKNPETFREKVLKAASDSEKDSAVVNTVKKPLRFFGVVFKPFQVLATKTRKAKALKPVFKALAFIGRIVFPKYFRSSFHELKKVTWPSFKQGRRLTYAVLIFAIVFGATVAIVDYGLGKIFKHLLLK